MITLPGWLVGVLGTLLVEFIIITIMALRKR